MSLKVTSHLQRPKNSAFSGYLDELNSNIQPDVSIGKKRKKKPSFFQTKVSKSERCHDLGPGGIFAATAHVEARFLCYFHILFTSRTLYNSHEEFFAFEKIFPMEKSKAEESNW